MEEETIEENCCLLDQFAEYEIVKDIINNVRLSCESEKNSESAFQKLKGILEKYSDQPHLIDGFLEEYLISIVKVIRDPQNSMKLKDEAFKYLFLLITVRGYKALCRFLPREVGDIEIILDLLGSQSEEGSLDGERASGRMERNYCLLLWLSMIVMLPFDMKRMEVYTEGETTLPDRIINACKKHIVTNDKSHHAASILLARLVSRNDTKDTYLPLVIEWALQSLREECAKSSWKKFGPMVALYSILKHCSREDLIKHASPIFDCVYEGKLLTDKYHLTKKYATKIYQRIALAYLPVKVASWRYKRGCRVLSATMTNGEQGERGKCESESGERGTASNESSFSSEHDLPTPKIVEMIISEILTALMDDNTMVRWSAAKGVGRITERMSMESADQIFNSLLAYFTDKYNCYAWSGACTALAELGRRGLLLTERLPQVVDIIQKALVYEVERGRNALASVVRDATCYLCWSLARAFDPPVLTPFINTLAASLIITAVFDREGNCRRAAAASFQEHVGRQGAFPHGIEIVTTVDFFSVGIREKAYLNVSLQVAQYMDYRYQMIDHLLQYKIAHWDPEIRHLTSKVLHELALLSPEYVTCKSEGIITRMFSVNICDRHGAVLAMGQIIYALCKKNERLNEACVGRINELIPHLQKKSYFRGNGGDLMKEAAALLIWHCSLGKFELRPETKDSWLATLELCLQSDNYKIQEIGSKAMAEFVQVYCGADEPAVDNIIEKCIARLANTDAIKYRIGYALALGTLPVNLLERHLTKITNALIACGTPDAITKKWVNARKEAAQSLVSIWKKMCYGSENKQLAIDFCPRLIEFLLKGLKDYTIDEKGEVGYIVRLASVESLDFVLCEASKLEDIILQAKLVENVLCDLSKQCVETTSKIRKKGAQTFVNILHSEVPREVRNLNDLRRLFPREMGEEITWLNETQIYDMFARLLDFDYFWRPVACGFVKSVASKTESTSRRAAQAITSYWTQQTNGRAKDFGEFLFVLLRESKRQDNLTVSLLAFYKTLLNAGIFEKIILDAGDDFAKNLYEIAKEGLAKIKSLRKFDVSLDVCAELLPAGGELSKEILVILARLLNHSVACVRGKVAIKFSEALILHYERCGLSEQTQESVVQILTGIDWESIEEEELGEKTNEIFKLLNISKSDLDEL